ncbi:hypothetical protein P7K49_007817 [Saguinus oedipus]|uniref:Uncharacterized protein n=1 Tax=Saguinus oedipus TaxID=9490 RepID=A0ABQ9VVZ0_SAGOE|nr:hypothetical protein P7K49_007817 [Saguinus oedipus]
MSWLPNDPEDPALSQAQPTVHRAPHPHNQLSGPHGDGEAVRPESSFISIDAAAGPNSSGMGSASPGLSSVSPSHLLLPPDSVSRTGLEKVAAGALGLERRDWSPSPPAIPEQGLSAFYLSYFDMLYPEDSSWAAKVPGASGREEPPEEPEQCPVIDSQAPGGSLDLGPGGLALEEHSLEQVQSMVVGEVLKDIETACKLLNITAVSCEPGLVEFPPVSAPQPCQPTVPTGPAPAPRASRLTSFEAAPADATVLWFPNAHASQLQEFSHRRPHPQG